MSGSEVHDRTWEYMLEREYFGIPFKHSYVTTVYQENKQYGLLNRWEEGFPLFFADPEEFLAG